MPGVYHTACRACGANLAETDWYDSLFREGKEIPLRHPVESIDLEKYDLTREKAARSGVLHRLRAYGCHKCGAVTYVKTLALPTELTGVFLLLLLGTVAGFALLVTRKPWWCALVVAVVLVPYVKLDVYLNRLLTLKKHGFAVDTLCTNCGSSDTVQVSQLLLGEKAPLRCNGCGERQRFVDHVGWS